ncbi:MAG: hypothetical protein WC783_04275 [Candidatus Paceibacterota bacterium]|jgi:hypothetical protein
MLNKIFDLFCSRSFISLKREDSLKTYYITEVYYNNYNSMFINLQKIDSDEPTFSLHINGTESLVLNFTPESGMILKLLNSKTEIKFDNIVK